MKLIKNDLSQLGISHDNFFSETDLVNKDLVKKAVKKLKDKKVCRRGFS
jgi:arginyl-tRNA synthetase